MTRAQERPASVPEPAGEEAAGDAPQDEFLRPRRWTTGEYYRMSDLGLFDEERVELLDGEIWTLPLEDGTEPGPDVAVVPGSRCDYVEAHPTPAEIRLLVEVSDATLRKDRSKKLNDYARAGITDYWIINLVQRQLEVYRDPAPMNGGYGYKTVRTLFDDDSIAPLSAPTGTVAVADLFPPLKP